MLPFCLVHIYLLVLECPEKQGRAMMLENEMALGTGIL